MMLFVPSVSWETVEIQPHVYDEAKAHFDNEVKEGYDRRNLGFGCGDLFCLLRRA